MRGEIQRIVDELVARHRSLGAVGLDDIAEVIGDRSVTAEEVEEIVDALELEGLVVGEAPDHAQVERMKQALAAARALSLELGRKPSIAEIAARAALPEHVVRRALDDARRIEKKRP